MFQEKEKNNLIAGEKKNDVRLNFGLKPSLLATIKNSRAILPFVIEIHKFSGSPSILEP